MSNVQYPMPNLRQRGYIAISTVVLILAVILALTITMSYSAIGEAQSGLVLYQGEDNFQDVEGCVEDAILKIRANASYNGTSITRPEGTCSITYNAGGSGPTNWDLTVTLATSVKRSIRVIFTRGSSGITLTSWNEI